MVDYTGKVILLTGATGFLGKKMVKDKKLNLQLNSKVTSIIRDKDSWSVTVKNKKPQNFDIVIMSTSPKDALNFMPPGHGKDLLSVATVPANWPSKDIMIAKLAPGYTGFPSTFGAWVMPFGTKAQQWPMFPFFWQKRYANDYVLFGQGVPPQIPPAHAWVNAQNFTNLELPFNISALVETVRVDFPSFPRHPDDWNAWNDGWPSEQGLNDMYYIGEAFGGSGIPGIIDFFTHLRASKLTTKFKCGGDL